MNDGDGIPPYSLKDSEAESECLIDEIEEEEAFKSGPATNVVVCRTGSWCGHDWYCLYDGGEDYFSDACVEGTGLEMSCMARAILAREDYAAKRCAVEFKDSVVAFYSPRNTQGEYGWMSVSSADELANQILELISE